MPGVGGALSLWEACLLGAVQGATEFLPISSSGHLALTQYLLTPMPPEQKLAVDVALHLGTLAAVVAYFWHDLLTIAVGLLRAPRRRDSTWPRLMLLLVGTFPAAVAGVLLHRWIAATLDSLAVIGPCFLFTGTLLYLASAVRGATRAEEDIRPRDALFVGCFQALALLPGVSRSGTTICAGLFRRLRPEAAARFSFLLAVPAISGAVAFESPAVLHLAPAVHGPLLAGVVVAGLTGAAAIAVLFRALRTGRLHWFAYYCWALGALVLVSVLVGGT